MEIPKDPEGYYRLATSTHAGGSSLKERRKAALLNLENAKRLRHKWAKDYYEGYADALGVQESAGPKHLEGLAPDYRVAIALERIAEALEKIAETPAYVLEESPKDPLTELYARKQAVYEAAREARRAKPSPHSPE